MPADRLVAIFGADGDDRVREQLAVLAAETDRARELDVGYLEVRAMPQAATFREIAAVGADEFAVVLVEDGTEIHRSAEVVSPDEVWRAFGRGDRDTTG
jgi:hypothetical protein